MEEVLRKMEKKYESLTEKISVEKENVASLAYEISALDEIKSIVEAGDDSVNEKLEQKIDEVLEDLTSFAYKAKFEISVEDMEYALTKTKKKEEK